MAERVRCDLCGGWMELKEDKEKRGRWKWRYACAECGAHARFARTKDDALKRAREYRADNRQTRMPVICPYYMRHSYKARTIECEAVICRARKMVVVFSKDADQRRWMINNCRKYDTDCPMAEMCAQKYED